MTDGSYWAIGCVLGAIVGIITFLGSWWYCAANYGFLLGFGLGWLPAGIAAGLAGLATALLWGLVAGAILLGLAWFALNHFDSSAFTGRERTSYHVMDAATAAESNGLASRCRTPSWPRLWGARPSRRSDSWGSSPGACSNLRQTPSKRHVVFGVRPPTESSMPLT